MPYKSPTITPDRRVALYFSQDVFSENFLYQFSGRNSQRKIRLEGWGVQIPVQILRIFRSAPWGLSNRRAMIPAAKWNALLRWTVSGNQFLQLLQLPAALSSWLLRTVKMPTAHDSGASSFRHECIVRSCAVCIICTCASLPSLKMPPISRVVPHPSFEIAPNTPQAPSFVCPAYHWQCRT